MELSFYDTFQAKKVQFVPRDEGNLYMYVCGFTPNNYPHVGHARTAIIFDIIKKIFEKNGFIVHYLSNFTDIDDKIIAKANEEGIPPKDVAEKYINIYLEAMKALNVCPPIKFARVTENITEIVEMISVLISKGNAYASDGDVYYNIRSFPEYGKLSKRSIREMLVGARVEPGEKKRDPLDFALWKKAKPGEPSWESPWGLGRPGWHIECSVMSLKYLRTGFDIHGGAQDLIFPHHENEIAQSEAYTGEKPFSKYWIHTGWVTKDHEKMSKSLGNVFRIDEVLNIVSPNVLRFFLISTMYSSPMEFQQSSLSQANKNFERIVITLNRLNEKIKTSDKDKLDEEINKKFTFIGYDFNKALLDNFNTPLALSIIITSCKEINKLIDEGLSEQYTLSILKNFLLDWLDTLNFSNVEKTEIKNLDDSLLEKVKILVDKYLLKIENDNLEEIITKLIELRNIKRNEKDYETSDSIRKDLLNLNIQLEDKLDRTDYRIISDIDVN
jgi:cysteinyl-tRNA synthetase